MVEPFRIHRGDRGPVQQSPVTCGSTSLIVARMLVDPVCAGWVVEGGPSHDLPAGYALPGGRNLPGGRERPVADTQDQRLAALEQVVLTRTNSVRGPGGRLQLPWPRRLGTPPWGARSELESGAAEIGARYELAWCRLGGEERLRRHHDELRQRVRQGRPAILYVGSTWVPRHVALVLPAASGGGVDVYDPATGGVQALPVDTFVTRRLELAGWDLPWCLVLPRREPPATS